MVARGFRLTKIWVQLPAPHPLVFLLLSVVVMSGSASAADLDHYAAAPDTLASTVLSSDSLARVVGGDIFGIYWSSFGGNGQITAIDGVSMRDRADGVQELATATYSTFKGVEKAIAEVAASDPLILQWLETIYDQLYSSSRSGDVVTKTSVADLVSSALGIMSSVPGYSWFNGTSGQWASASNIAGALSHLNSSLFNSIVVTNWLDLYGSRSSGQISLARGMGQGFLGLAHLFFGSSGRDIFGLGRNGLSEIGQRGSWSLADIIANGMLGLGHLIGGDYPDGREYFWTWTDPSDPSHVLSYNVSSLFDLFFEIQTLQSSLAKLEYVYASQDDIEFKEQEKPNMDAVKDSFFGDGEGAVNPDQIKDAAGISSAAKDAFGGAGSPGDAFTAINDSQSFWFFSQEVADALDTVNAVSPASEEEDDFMDQFVRDEDGFYSLIDLSPWDVNSYLEGEG